ncbi:hypothetical protein H5410_031038, partial [Solanum commersonii]
MKVFNKAFSNAKAKSYSTACILTLSNNTLHDVNVGDSEFVVIRDLRGDSCVQIESSAIRVYWRKSMFWLEVIVDCAICTSVRKSHRSMNFGGERGCTIKNIDGFWRRGRTHRLCKARQKN